MGRTFRQVGKNKQAETCFNYSYTHFGQLGNPTGEVAALRSLGELYEGRGDAELALRCMTRILEIQSRYGLPGKEEDQQRINRLRKTYHTK